MPTPERAAQPRPTPSALSMKALLASCAAAAVSTPPSDAPEASGAADRDEASTHPETARRRAA